MTGRAVGFVMRESEQRDDQISNNSGAFGQQW